MKKVVLVLAMLGLAFTSCDEEALQCNCKELVDGYEIDMQGNKTLIYYEQEASQDYNCEDDGKIIDIYDNRIIRIKCD